jgi:type IV pilus assembly protein PilN
VILVNLLPHRERQRARRRRGFYAGLALSAALGAGVLAAAWSVLSQQVATQAARNAYLEAGIARLDLQIKDIAGLRAEMAELEARGRVVQTLQGRRNQSVRVLEALAARAPQGLQLLAVRQTGPALTLSGVALGSEHVAMLMREAIAPGSPFERAELVEVRAVAGLGSGTAGPAPRRYEFAMRLSLRAQADAAPVPGPGSGPAQGLLPAPRQTQEPAR